jgi:hypothetical protein
MTKRFLLLHTHNLLDNSGGVFRIKHNIWRLSQLGEVKDFRFSLKKIRQILRKRHDHILIIEDPRLIFFMLVWKEVCIYSRHNNELKLRFDLLANQKSHYIRNLLDLIAYGLADHLSQRFATHILSIFYDFKIKNKKILQKTHVVLPILTKHDLQPCSSIKSEKIKTCFIGSPNWFPNNHTMRQLNYEAKKGELSNHTISLIGRGIDQEYLEKVEFKTSTFKSVGYCHNLTHELSKYDFGFCEIILGSGLKIKIIDCYLHGLGVLASQDTMYCLAGHITTALPKDFDELVVKINDYQQLLEISKNCKEIIDYSIDLSNTTWNRLVDKF